MISFRPLPDGFEPGDAVIDLLPFFDRTVWIEWLEHAPGLPMGGLVQARFLNRYTKPTRIKSQGALQFWEYLARERQTWEMVLLYPEGFSPFFLEVYERLLQDVPYGDTLSYSALATRVKRPNSPRAVGLAMSKNPWPLVVPCHRVVTKTGQLGGYGGGIENKRKLLEMERRSMD